MTSLKELSSKIKQALSWDNLEEFSKNVSAPFRAGGEVFAKPIVRSFNQVKNNTNPSTKAGQSFWSSPIARGLIDFQRNNPISPIFSPKETSLVNQAKALSTFENPLLKSFGRFGSMSLGSTAKGSNTFQQGAKNVYSGVLNKDPIKAISGVAGVGVGGGQVLAQTNPLVWGSKALASLPGTENMNLPQNIPFIGGINVPETGASMVEFVKNPAWGKIFPQTSKFLTVLNPSSPGGKLVNFILGRTVKGGTEGLIQAMATYPDKGTADEKVSHFMGEIGFGVVSEIAFDSIAKSVKWTGDKTKLKNVIVNLADRLFQDAKRFKGYATEPYWASGKTKLQTDLEGRKFKNVSGAVNPDELVKTVKELQQDPQATKEVETPIIKPAMDESTIALDKEIREAQKEVKIKFKKGVPAIISKQEGQEKLTQAVVGGENEKAFKGIFNKWIGERDVARTTGAEYGVKFRDISKKEAKAFINHAEGIKLSDDPKVVAKAEQWKQTTDTLYNDLQTIAKQEGVDLGYIDNYVTHFWKESPEKVQQTMSIKGRSFGSRGVPTYKEGIEMGLTPKYSNPAEIMSEYVAKIEKTRANINLFKEMKNRNLIVPASVGRNTLGFSPVQAPGFPRSVTSYESKVFDGSYYAPTNIAREINRIFSPEDFGKVGKTLNVAAKMSKGTQDIVLSGGIPATPINAFTLAQTTKEFTSGSFVRPIKALGISLFPDQSLKYFQENAGQIKKMQARNVTVRSSFDTQGLKGGGNLWDKLISDATFKRFMPTLQVELFNNIEKRAMGRGMGANEAADIAAKAVKNFYGMTNTGNVAMRSQLGKDITSTFAFAPTYRESMINFWVNSLKAFKNPLALENSQNIKFLVGATVIYGIMDHLNKQLNGHPMSENPTGKDDKLLIPAGDTTIGVPFLSSIATVPRGIYRIAKDALALDMKAAGADTLRTFGSMLVKPVGEMVLNEDYFGQQIYDPEASTIERGQQIASYLFKANQHPYIKATLEAKGTPIYQTLSKAAELPFRFYKTSSIKNAPFWDEYFKVKAMDEKLDIMRYKDPQKAVGFYKENKSLLDNLPNLKERIKAYYESGQDSTFLQQDMGVAQTDEHMAFVGTDGKFHMIDTNFEVPLPTYTGNELLDKKIKSSYISKLTAVEKNILTLFENSIITADQAEEALAGVKDLKTASGVGAKKPKKITIKAAPKISYKLKSSNTKSSPFKLSAPPKVTMAKASTISLKVDEKSLPAIKLKPPVNTLDKGIIKLV